MRNNNTLVVIMLLITTGFCSAQEFKSVKEINQLLSLNAIQFEDSLIKKGFQFEKSEGNIFRYKKNASRIDFKMNPKEVTYSFTDRSFYLRTYSELEAEGYKLIKAEEEIAVQNTVNKADHLAKDAYHVYLWNSIDGAFSTNMYSLKVSYSTNSTIVSENKAPSANQNKTEFSFFDYTEKLQKELIHKKQPRVTVIDTSGSISPKPILANLSVGWFRFVPETNLSISSMQLNVQIGYQKSKLNRMRNRPKWLSDGGVKVDLAFMPGIEYTAPDESYSIKMLKCYFVLNQYTAVKLKSFDLVFQGGFFLNYNHGRSLLDTDFSASFWDVGFHFGEQIQKKLGRTPQGYPAMVIGLGFDHYFDVSGGYIGSLGVNIGF